MRTTIRLDHPALEAVHVVGDRFAKTGIEATMIDCAVVAQLATWTVCLWLCGGHSAANEDLRRWIAQHQEERAAIERALKDATDAAGTTSMHGQGRIKAVRERP